MQIDLHSIAEQKPSEKWQQHFEQHWPSYRKWFLSKSSRKTPNLKTCRARLKKYMPEFYPTYLQLCELAGPDSVAHRFLSGYQPPAYISGCAQVVNEKEAQLIRNYDFDPKLSEGTLLFTKWDEQEVMGMSDCLIGLVDGMNQSGLVVSLTFGGRKVVGKGFGIPFILRYVLQYCTTLEEAVAALERIPSHMSYNIMLMNHLGEHKLVQVAPDREPVITNLSASTNHQNVVDWPEHATFTKTIERELYLQELLALGTHSSDQIAEEFLKAPLFNQKYKMGFGTIYTAVYQPKKGALELKWPDTSLRQEFTNFQEGTTRITYNEGKVSASASIPTAQLREDYNTAVEDYWTEYGKAWTSNEHEAIQSVQELSARIQELLEQMDYVAKTESSYPWQTEVKPWMRVEMKK